MDMRTRQQWAWLGLLVVTLLAVGSILGEALGELADSPALGGVLGLLAGFLSSGWILRRAASRVDARDSA
jgi:hypothetical protein